MKSDIFMQISFGSDGFIGPQQLEIYFSISYFNCGTAQSGDKAAFRFALNKKYEKEIKKKGAWDVQSITTKLQNGWSWFVFVMLVIYNKHKYSWRAEAESDGSKALGLVL